MATRRRRRLRRQRPGQVRSARCRARTARTRAPALHRAHRSPAVSTLVARSPPSVRTASRSWSKNMNNQMKEGGQWGGRRRPRRLSSCPTMHPNPSRRPSSLSPTLCRFQACVWYCCYKGCCWQHDGGRASTGGAAAARTPPLLPLTAAAARAPVSAPRAYPSLPRARPLAPWAVVQRAQTQTPPAPPPCTHLRIRPRRSIHERPRPSGDHSEAGGAQPLAAACTRTLIALSHHSPYRVCRWRRLLGGTGTILARRGNTWESLARGLIGPLGARLRMALLVPARMCERGSGGVSAMSGP